MPRPNVQTSGMSVGICDTSPARAKTTTRHVAHRLGIAQNARISTQTLDKLMRPPNGRGGNRQGSLPSDRTHQARRAPSTQKQIAAVAEQAATASLDIEPERHQAGAAAPAARAVAARPRGWPSPEESARPLDGRSP